MIGLLRGVNLGGHHKVKMDELRALCQRLKLRDVKTYVQSGNIVFRTDEKDAIQLAGRIEKAIERKFGFHSDVVLRTSSELRDVVGSSPFKGRKDLLPAKLIVTFLACELAKEKCDRILLIKAGLEEVKLGGGRELYIYFPDGMGKSKLPALLDRALEKTGTARNWNTVTKLLEMAEAMESAAKAQ